MPKPPEILTVEPSSAPAKRDETKRAEPGAAASRTERLVSSPVLVRLAAKLGLAVNDLTARLSPETVRRTKLPMHAEEQLDGSTVYRSANPVVTDYKAR